MIIEVLIIMALKRLHSEIKQCRKDINYFYSIDVSSNNFYQWNFVLIGPPDTIYEGGTFEGIIEFPKNYPYSPPSVVFKTNMFHPNIYPDGRVCISILHEGVDAFNYEDTSLRWNTSHGVNSIMMSIVSMLGDPNTDSPANIDASKLFKENYVEFKKRVYSLIKNT